MPNYRYIINKDSGKGTGEMEIVRLDTETWETKQLIYRDGARWSFMDAEPGIPWHKYNFGTDLDVYKFFFNPRGVTPYGDYVIISNKEAEALIQEMEMTGKIAWRCPFQQLLDSEISDDTVWKYPEWKKEVEKRVRIRKIVEKYYKPLPPKKQFRDMFENYLDYHSEFEFILFVGWPTWVGGKKELQECFGTKCPNDVEKYLKNLAKLYGWLANELDIPLDELWRQMMVYLRRIEMSEKGVTGGKHTEK